MYSTGPGDERSSSSDDDEHDEDADEDEEDELDCFRTFLLFDDTDLLDDDV